MVHIDNIRINGQKTTREDIESRNSDYCCFDCGKQFISDKLKQREPSVVTAHLGQCGLCGSNSSITHIRVFNWLNTK